MRRQPTVTAKSSGCTRPCMQLPWGLRCKSTPSSSPRRTSGSTELSSLTMTSRFCLSQIQPQTSLQQLSMFMWVSRWLVCCGVRCGGDNVTAATGSVGHHWYTCISSLFNLQVKYYSICNMFIFWRNISIILICFKCINEMYNFLRKVP